ncbi:MULTISPECIES: YkvA family protein [Gammaproteobacteria]|jgi:uncharacterized membrane protein YkvA (DUF1232 family)|uniref:YkvA family protein n=1 Tax=Gammaproteobacteria TaxID=1236 RepID=UPI0007CFD9F7|nr:MULTISPECIES: DUF1232 domain-containing protein [unclassified Alteromonas]KZZ12237.1 hypothetical protein A3746_02060 [Oleibacter sp. HI0075]OUX84144.1 MAG: hypothetical protein CBB95_16485 [Alteromonas sp. TMED35]PHR98478.1 MAG: DUF1232 domain-containing protein [Oceanobacter sp.]AUC88302.1 DUF1232 domain-containing protein [Alteromonas sp. MB-3u-76]MAI39254.1 DUF1232 domain-containing protein [Alteromonas sp.]|tara:strand:- start:34261 stop:34650 length:390 start_codon:yes stop_codon:yes gene_type:complete
MSTVLTGRLRAAAKRIKHDALTVYFVARDPNTPILVRLLALAIAAYALSPIDLIPDFIPILGYLDDIILLPLGIILVIKLTPSSVIEVSRSKAAKAASKPTSQVAAAVVIVIWLLCAAAFGYWVWDYGR